MQDLWAAPLEYTDEELRELEDLVPATELWAFPEPLPGEIEVEMPGEQEVQVIFTDYFGADAPADWTIEKARAMVNVGRKRLYRLWKRQHG